MTKPNNSLELTPLRSSSAQLRPAVILTMLFPSVFAVSVGLGVFGTLGIVLEPLIEGYLPELLGVSPYSGYWILLATALLLSAGLSVFHWSPLRGYLQRKRLKPFIIALPIGYVGLVALFILLELVFLRYGRDQDGGLILFALWLPLWYAPGLATLCSAYWTVRST